MSELSVGKVYDGEIVKHLDFDYTFEQILRNVEVLGGLLRHKKETDFVIGGNVSPDTARTVMVSPLLCLGKSLDTPVYNPDVSEALLLPASDIELDRFDIVEVQSVIEVYEPVQRAIYNPQLEAAEYKVTVLNPFIRYER